MTRSPFTRRRLAGAAAICAAVVVAGGVATAAASSSTAVIKGCYATKGGTFKITSKCPKGYKAISWNATGRTGATGKTGARGAQGIQGVRGLQGVQGIQGVQGPQGPGALQLSYKRDVNDTALTTLATYRGYTFSGQCNYSSATTQSSAALYMSTPANVLYDLTGPAIAMNASVSPPTVIAQNVVTKFHSGGTGNLLMIFAPGSSTVPHSAIAWGPMSFTGTGADGTVTTFSLMLTLTTNSAATGVNANEGRCRIEGTLTPTS